MEERAKNGPGITPQLILGLAIVAVGVLFTLDNLGWIESRGYWSYWPVLLIILGLAKACQSAGSPGRLIGAFLAVFGVLLLLGNLEVIAFDFRRYWPLILVLIGGGLVWQALGRRGRAGRQGASIRGAAILGGFKGSSISPEFSGGELTALLGGCEFDLTQASIGDGEAVIHCFAFWGGIEIRVPEDWEVRVQGTPVLGGFEDGTRPPREPTGKRLVVGGFAIMGAVEVKN